MPTREQLAAEIDRRRVELASLQKDFAKLTTPDRGQHIVMYGRQSHDPNDQPLTRATQEAQMQEYIGRRMPDHKAIVIGLFDEDVSGGTQLFERPNGRKVNLILEKGDHLIMAKLDRGFRNLADQALTCQLMEMRGIHMHFLDANIDTTTAMGKAFLAMMGVFAECERNRTSERIKDAFARMKAAGVPIFAPFGWRKVGHGLRSKFVPDDTERRIGKMLVEWYDVEGLRSEQMAWRWAKERHSIKRQRRSKQNPFGESSINKASLSAWMLATRMGFPLDLVAAKLEYRKGKGAA